MPDFPVQPSKLFFVLPALFRAVSLWQRVVNAPGIKLTCIHTYIRPRIYVQMYTFYYHRDKDNLYTVHAALGHCRGKLIKACFNRIEQICEKRVATELRLSSHLIQESWHFVRFLMLGKDSLMRTEIASQKSNSVWMVWPFTPGLCGLYDVYLTAAVVSTLVSSQGH